MKSCEPLRNDRGDILKDENTSYHYVIQRENQLYIHTSQIIRKVIAFQSNIEDMNAYICIDYQRPKPDLRPEDIELPVP